MMPPSGFVKIETNILGAFAENILTRFNQEIANGKFSSIDEGVKYELLIIDKYLSSNISNAERGVLKLMKQFYISLQEGKTSNQIVEDIRNLSSKHYD